MRSVFCVPLPDGPVPTQRAIGGGSNLYRRPVPGLLHGRIIWKNDVLQTMLVRMPFGKGTHHGPRAKVRPRNRSLSAHPVPYDASCSVPRFGLRRFARHSARCPQSRASRCRVARSACPDSLRRPRSTQRSRRSASLVCQGAPEREAWLMCRQSEHSENRFGTGIPN